MIRFSDILRILANLNGELSTASHLEPDPYGHSKVILPCQQSVCFFLEHPRGARQCSDCCLRETGDSDLTYDPLTDDSDVTAASLWLEGAEICEIYGIDYP